MVMVCVRLHCLLNFQYLCFDIEVLQLGWSIILKCYGVQKYCLLNIPTPDIIGETSKFNNMAQRIDLDGWEILYPVNAPTF